MVETRRPARSPRLLLWSVLVVSCSVAAPLLAAPDFTTTAIAVTPDPPFEGEVATYTVTVRNSGADDAGVVDLRAEWPLMAFLVDVEGLDAPVLDHDGRQIEARFPLPAGGERRVVIRVLMPRDSAGDGTTLALRLNHWDSGTEHWDRLSSTVDWRPATDGFVLGGLRFTHAALAVLGVLALGGMVYLVLLASGRSRRARGGAFAAAFAITIGVGFWAIFGAMAWRDYQSITAWRETRCTILGGRLSAQGTTRTRTTAPSGTATRDDTNYVPVLGLRYEADGRQRFSSGYDTGSRLGIGGRAGREEELAEWTVGATVPCWYDPADPQDVVVRNGFGGAYLFALFPVPVFLFGVWQARRIMDR